MPPVKTGESPRLVKIVARRRVGSKRRRTFLYRCEWDDDTWSWESSKVLEEDPVYFKFLQLHPEYPYCSLQRGFSKNSCEVPGRPPEPAPTVLHPGRPELPLDLHLLEHHRRTSSMLTRSPTTLVPNPQGGRLQLAAAVR